MDYHILGIPSRLDHHNVAQTKDLIVNASPASGGFLVLDFNNCEFMDSSGLGMLVHTATQEQLNVCLVGLSPRVRSLLKLTQVDKILSVFNCLDTALAALKTA